MSVLHTLMVRTHSTRAIVPYVESQGHGRVGNGNGNGNGRGAARETVRGTDAGQPAASRRQGASMIQCEAECDSRW